MLALKISFAVIIIIIVIYIRIFYEQEKFSGKIDEKGTYNGYYKCPSLWRKILNDKVSFYIKLTEKKKEEYEFKIQKFFQDYQIVGYNTSIDITDRLLVAAGGVIPVFSYRNWNYSTLERIYIISDDFNSKYETGKEDCDTAGKVKGRNMYLSKTSLFDSFENSKDRFNTAIHEFAHFIDFADYKSDGFPGKIIESDYLIPWQKFILKTAQERKKGELDEVRDYAFTNQKEFFAVMCEYYFEQPEEMKEKYPEGYKILHRAFSQKVGLEFVASNIRALNKNSNCPCNSGKIFKNCCIS